MKLMRMRVPRTWWPSRCLLCGGKALPSMDLCAGCHDDMPVNAACCARCALPLPRSIALCGHCQQREPPWGRAWAPFRYDWPLDRLETRYKFAADLAAGRILAQLWCEHVPEERPSAVVPVPLHDGRLRSRGYDQALELARRIARNMGVPLRDGHLKRIRATAAQSDLSAMARRRNVRHAFVVADAVSLPTHVALFDDVMTTGATLESGTRALLRAGVQRVDVWAIARVSEPGR